ncbi:MULTISPECIES: phage shock protein PspA [Neptunomonas]|uniref:Phage shock protein PspA n=1 Tax=Neptunomonas marina TaxID=1815562 RepID=A0A437Q4V8_9GAMM|nr:MULTISPECIES: phage shock protein PspA [Neptunomonas]RVU29522.1 phage shock protein PspA [Neptunomonas marina]
MGIFSRFQDIVNANINSLLDRAEDPEKMIRLMIQEMEETLIEVRSTSAKVIADKKTLERRMAALTQDAEDWEQKAALAITRGREDLARAALAEQAAATETLELGHNELDAIESHLEDLNSEISQLQHKLDDAKAKQKSMLAREQSARSRLEIRRRFNRDKLNEAFEKFERYERKMDNMEAEVESYDLGSKDLAEEIADLERDEAIDEALAKLKARMDKKDSGE